MEKSIIELQLVLVDAILFWKKTIFFSRSQISKTEPKRHTVYVKNVFL